MILKHHESTSVKIGRLGTTSKARREANRNKFVEKSGIPDRAESLGKVDHSEDGPATRFRFVKPIQIAETYLAAREIGVRLQKEE